MKRSLGVIVLSQYFHPEVGATQTRARELARAFQRAGHRVTVICEFPNHPQGIIPERYRGRWTEWDALDGYRVLRVRVAASPVKTFRTRIAFYISYFFMATLCAFRRLGKVDLVVATSPPLPVAGAGALLAGVRRAPFVMDVRDLWTDAGAALGELKNPRLLRLAAAIELWLYRRAEYITVVTRAFGTAIAAKGIPAAKLGWFPNGTLPELFGPERVDPELRARLGIPAETFLVGFAGVFSVPQGMDFLIDLAASYREEAGIAFLFVGDGPLRARMAARIQAEGLAARVQLHPQVPTEQAAYFLNAADVLLVPLRNDPVFASFVPSKLFDCLACAPPVLLSVPGEARSLLEESGGGLFAEPEDLASFRAAIAQLRADPAAARAMGAAGQRYVLPRFERARVMDAMVATLTSQAGD